MKVAIYCRVSTDDKGQDPKVQLYRCRDYCEYNNHQVIAELIDEGISGDTYYYDRPQGKELDELIRKKKIDGIICFAMDRFSRQNPMKVLPMINHLKDVGVKFISITEPVFNMEGELSEPMRYFFTWFNNYFLKQHKRKVKAGIEKAQKYGTKSGKPIGRQRKVNYDTIIGYYQNGMNLSQISKKMDISKSSVWNAIHQFKKRS
jgi:DNA invertase Pin-like site-specific DNA recombinase